MLLPVCSYLEDRREREAAKDKEPLLLRAALSCWPNIRHTVLDVCSFHLCWFVCVFSSYFVVQRVQQTAGAIPVLTLHPDRSVIVFVLCVLTVVFV